MTDSAHSPVPAGWYPDPRGLPQRRWWDGSAWTHALEAPPAAPAPGTSVPAYASMPGPSVRRTPSPNAPMVHHAIRAEAGAGDGFPTRRQLRDAEAAVELQRQLTEPAPVEPSAAGGGGAASPSYAMGPAVSATQKPQASFSIEQFRTVATQGPTENVTKAAAEVAKSPAISTAAAASLGGVPVRPIAQTLPAVAAATPVSAFTPTHTFTAAPAAAVPAAATEHADSVFVPVMRTGEASTPAASPSLPGISDDIEYRPFGMTPRITTGTVEAPTHVNTAAVWLLTLMPSLLLGVAIALSVYAPDFYTPFTIGGLSFVFAIGSLALATSDRRQLGLRDHQATASPAWVLLTPLAYLVGRAVRTRQQAGRGWAPVVVFALLTAAGIAAVVLAPSPLASFTAAG